jgi:hypothetical protein
MMMGFGFLWMGLLFGLPIAGLLGLGAIVVWLVHIAKK